MTMQLDIPCNLASIETSPGDKKLIVACEEARADVVLEQIINELGITATLNTIGLTAVAEYMRQNGFTVIEDSWKAA